MTIDEEFWAKAPIIRAINNHGIKPVVIDNEPVVGFSPYILFLADGCAQIFDQQFCLY